MTDSNASPDAGLPFTGERFTPECVREIWYEHWHRYVFAQPLASGRRVLDAACGEGYGSALLARTAASVVGVDLDPATVDHARRRYGTWANVEYRCASVAAIDEPDGAFDLIVSFETIEHLAEQAQMLAEFRRLLAPAGLLLLSSPDREIYNRGAAEPNPFHVRELDRGELLDLLRPHFPAVRLYGQKLAFHSVLWRLQDGEGEGSEIAHMDTATGTVRRGQPADPVYYVAVCAATPEALPVLPGLSLFADEQASVYSHYNSEIARLIHADHRLIELERELAAAKAALAARE